MGSKNKISATVRSERRHYDMINAVYSCGFRMLETREQTLALRDDLLRAQVTGRQRRMVNVVAGTVAAISAVVGLAPPGIKERLWVSCILMGLVGAALAFIVYNGYLGNERQDDEVRDEREEVRKDSLKVYRDKCEFRSSSYITKLVSGKRSEAPDQVAHWLKRLGELRQDLTSNEHKHRRAWESADDLESEKLESERLTLVQRCDQGIKRGN